MERENQSLAEIKTTTANGATLPQFSFAASDNAPRHLTAEQFDIDAKTNQPLTFTAYYDSSHKLIFVIDRTFDPRTPNTLLVINRDPRDPARKWDDILSRDHAVDLETVRPKKNNKYQKLDIEYKGLSVYSRLIYESKANENMDSALSDLDDFRAAAAARSANLRMGHAREEIRTATETLKAAEFSISDNRAQIKRLREKLSVLRANIGKEPAKESAAKILRAQSRIESASEKLKRAETRARRAKRRLDDAESDADAAEKQLSALSKVSSSTRGEKEIIMEVPKSKAENMAEEVKPLFNEDPKIMNEEIAFKPVEFSVPPAPEFAPPVFNAPEALHPAELEVLPTPEIVSPDVPIAPVTNTARAIEPSSVPPSVQPSRPLPQGGMDEIPVAQIEHQRPSAVYYIMLAILIALSVMTLWLYQNKMSDTVPNLTERQQPAEFVQAFDDNPGAYAAPVVKPSPEIPIVKPEDDNPFLDAGVAPPLQNENKPAPAIEEDQSSGNFDEDGVLPQNEDDGLNPPIQDADYSVQSTELEEQDHDGDNYQEDYYQDVQEYSEPDMNSVSGGDASPQDAQDQNDAYDSAESEDYNYYETDGSN